MTSHVGEEPAIIMIVLTVYSRGEVGEVGTAQGPLGGALIPGWEVRGMCRLVCGHRVKTGAVF